MSTQTAEELAAAAAEAAAATASAAPKVEDEGEESTAGMDRGDELGGGAPLTDAEQAEAAALAAAPAAAAADDGKPKFVPHARFNEVNEALKTEREARIRAEERAKVLEELSPEAKAAAKANEPPPAVDMKALRKQRMEAMMEGDTDKALELDEQIEERVLAVATQQAEARLSQRDAKQTLDTVVAESMTAYPFLNDKGADANADAIDMVVAVRNQHMQAGKSAAEALRLAVNKVAPLYGKATPAKDVPMASKTPAEVRAALALNRNAKTALQQPAQLGTVAAGNRATGATPTNVADLSEDEFDKLTAREKAVLRGDVAA